MLAAHRGTVSSGFPLGADTVSLQSVGAGPRGGRSSRSAGRATLTAADRHLVNAAVMLLTIRLEQSSTQGRRLGLLRSAVLRLVLSGQAELAGPIAEQLSLRTAQRDRSRCWSRPATSTAIAAELGWIDPASRRTGCWSPQLDGVLVAVVGGGERRRVRHRGPDRVGRPRPARRRRGRLCRRRRRTSDIAVAYRQARQAADFGHRQGRAVTRFGEIAMPGITGMLPPEQALAFAESLLATAGRARHGRPRRPGRPRCGPGSPITGSGTRPPPRSACTGTPCGTGCAPSRNCSAGAWIRRAPAVNCGSPSNYWTPHHRARTEPPPEGCLPAAAKG